MKTTAYQRYYGREKGERHNCMREFAIRDLKQVAAIMGISAQRVQQIERAALRKIRRKMWAYRKEISQ